MNKGKYKGFYNIVRNEAKKEATIHIYGIIGGFDWDTWSYINTADAFLREFAEVESEADVIHVRINSPGGNVHDGLAIYNALYNSKKTILTYNDGICYSMAALLMLAGEKSHSFKNCLFMTHNVISAVWGNAQEMRTEADVLDKYDQALGTAIESKLGISSEKVSELYLNYKDNYFTAQEAKDIGFYDDIIDRDSAKIPEDVKGMSPQALLEHYAKMNFETGPNKPKNNDKKPLTMSKAYPKIEGVLNLKFGEGEASNGILLTEEQADQVEARLDEVEGELTTANTELQTSRDNVQALNDANTAALETINNTLGLEGDEKVTSLADGMTAMVNKINELGNGPGDQHTRAGKKEEADAKHSYIDFDSPIYNN
ncbi:head maturation protease, ClpP-related [Flagellimonas sp.]|uniref:head maturation protease, ClpP-related n=1 Tax=Flagellimonas sp. TaxID=2058762 RepID=UPI003BA85414